MSNRRKTYIIGGGLGGLFTGALLAKEDFEVIVLEKNASLGGGLQTFTRKGLVFETGMHVLGGLQVGGNVWRICRYLGILDQLDIRPADADCIDSVTYLSDGTTYRIPQGRRQFTDYLSRLFPDEADGIRQYTDALYRIAGEVDLFWLRESDSALKSHSDDFLLAADRFIARYVKDARLQDLLAYMNPMYGGVEGHTPAYIHALINVLYLEGSARFAGGSRQLTDALAGIIREKGGNLLTRQEVVGLDTEDKRVVRIHTAGTDYAVGPDDVVISDIHPQRLVPLLPEKALLKSYRNRIAAIPNTYSAFTLYVAFRENSFPYINHTCYLQENYGQVWHHADYDELTWPRGFMYMTPPEHRQGTFATKMIVNCLMPFSAVAEWENTVTGRRGQSYEAWKRWQADRIIRRLEQVYPDFRACVSDCWTSSPLTIRDYYNQPEGALYGMRKDCENIMLSQLPVFTKVSNLLLTGQNINLHGICGVPLTAINTVEALVGQNQVVRKINRV